MTYAPSPSAIESAVQWAKNMHADPDTPLELMIVANVIQHNYPDMFDPSPSEQAKLGEAWLANHAIYGELVVYRGDFPIPEEYGEGYWYWATVIDGETDYLTDTRLTLVRKLTDPHSSADQTYTDPSMPADGVAHSRAEMPNIGTLPQGTKIVDDYGWDFAKTGPDTWNVRSRWGDTIGQELDDSVLRYMDYPVTIYASIPF